MSRDVNRIPGGTLLIAFAVSLPRPVRDCDTNPDDYNYITTTAGFLLRDNHLYGGR